MTMRQDMRTPLKKVRGLGSGKSGTGHFWQQRLTALTNIPLTIVLLITVGAMQGNNLEAARETLANPLLGILLAAAIVSVCWHMKLGMQIVLEDYIHGDVTKFVVLVANNIFCAAVALISLYALVTIAVLGG